MKHLFRLFKHLWPLLFCLMGWSQAHATACPHTGSAYFKTEVGTKAGVVYEYTKRNISFKPGQVVAQDGRFTFTINIDYHEGGDSCIFTFPRPGSTYEIGGGLVLTIGNAEVQKHDGTYTATSATGSAVGYKCGTFFPVIGGNDYKWGNMFTASGVGYETWGCASDTMYVPFTIKGTYDGSNVTSLKPFYKASGYAGINGLNKGTYMTSSTSATGLSPDLVGLSFYTMAAGQHSANHSGYYADNTTTLPAATITAWGCRNVTFSNPSGSTEFTTSITGPMPFQISSNGFSISAGPCNFAPNDYIYLYPRAGSSDSPLKKVKSEAFMGEVRPFYKETYRFPCTNCNPILDEKIDFLVYRLLVLTTTPGLMDPCTATISQDQNGVVSYSNVSACKYLKLVANLATTQTDSMLSTVKTTDPSNKVTQYSFSKAQMGGLTFGIAQGASATPYQTASVDLVWNTYKLKAPFINGCNGNTTSYPMPPPNSFTEGLVTNNVSKLIGSFSSQTNLTGCTLLRDDVISSPRLTLGSDNTGTPNMLTLLSSAASGVQTVVDKYKLRWNSCPKTSASSTACVTGKSEENLIFQVTRSLSAVNAAATDAKTRSQCSPAFSINAADSSISMKNADGCDTATFNNQVDLIQTGNLRNVDPYIFQAPFATHNISARMTSGEAATPTALTNKIFNIAPLLSLKCQVVIKSSTRK